MALAALASNATRVLRQGIAGDLSSADAEVFARLDREIRSRVRGDHRAQAALAAVVENPRDEQSSQALAHELSYYVEVDPAFGSRLDRVVRNLRQATR